MSETELAAIALIADLRAALGDPEGRLMQDELIAHARAVKAAQVRGDVALSVLRQIASGKRRTREQRLAWACVTMLDELPEAAP